MYPLDSGDQESIRAHIDISKSVDCQAKNSWSSIQQLEVIQWVVEMTINIKTICHWS